MTCFFFVINISLSNVLECVYMMMNY